MLITRLILLIISILLSRVQKTKLARLPLIQKQKLISY
nr:MAG TPA: hypothetical protein [Caudoviricetes sp.]